MFNQDKSVAPCRRGLRSLASAVLASCVGFGAVAAEPLLTLDHTLQLAQLRSRQLAAQDAAAAAARDRAIAAAQLPDPVIKGGLTNLPVDGADRFSLTRDFMTMQSIGVMQEFTSDAKRRARGARFDRAAEIAQAGRLIALAELQQQAATAWLERHYLDRQVELLQTQRSETQLQVDAADAVYRGGGGSQADLFAARSAVAEIDDRIEQALLDSGSARIRLMRWVGDSANQALGAPPALWPVGLDEAMLERQLERHPRINLLTRQLAAAHADVELAQRNKQSDWSVELMYSKRGPAYSNMMSLTFSVPLQWDQPNRQDREVAAGLATLDKLQAERDEALRDSIAQTRLMLLELQSLRARLQIYDQSVLPLASERITASLTDYRSSAGTLADVLGARRKLIDARIEQLRLQIATARLWARLNFLIPVDDVVVAATEQ